MTSNKPITTGQIIKFNALLRQLGLNEDIKRDLIYQYTNKRSDKTNDMTWFEANALIANMDLQISRSTAKPKANDPEKEAAQRMRRKIISHAYQLGWTNPETGKADMKRLNAFLMEKGAVKKNDINDYSNTELRKIVSQFQQMVKHHLNQFK